MTVFSERVVQTTTTSGTGTYSLAGTPAGAYPFIAAFGSGVKVAYRVQNADNTIWEERIGTLTAGAPSTLTRGTLLRSSTGSTISWPDSTAKYIYNLPQASILNSMAKGNIGSTRPEWLEAGGCWIDSDATPWILYAFDGADDIPVLNIDAIANAVTLVAGSVGLAQLAASAKPIEIQAALGDEVSPVTVGTGKVTLRAPRAFTLTGVRASLTTAQSAGSIFTVDVKKNGVTVLSTLVTIDNGEKTSVTAATPPVISVSAIADDDELRFDVTQVGDGTAKGCKVTLLGTRA